MVDGGNVKEQSRGDGLAFCSPPSPFSAVARRHMCIAPLRPGPPDLILNFDWLNKHVHCVQIQSFLGLVFILATHECKASPRAGADSQLSCQTEEQALSRPSTSLQYFPQALPNQTRRNGLRQKAKLSS